MKRKKGVLVRFEFVLFEWSVLHNKQGKYSWFSLEKEINLEGGGFYFLFSKLNIQKNIS